MLFYHIIFLTPMARCHSLADMNAQIVDRIVSKFGTQTRMASMLGVNQSTIAYWKIRGIIPARQQGKILAVARREGIDVSPNDFFLEEVV